MFPRRSFKYMICLTFVLLGVWGCDGLLAPQEKNALTLEKVLEIFLRAQDEFFKDLPSTTAVKPGFCAASEI